MNSTLMISCGIVDLLRICRDNVMTNGLSNCDHIRGGNPRAKITTTYMRQKSLMSQRSTPLFRALESMFGGILSKSERDMYPLVSLSFVACHWKIA